MNQRLSYQNRIPNESRFKIKTFKNDDYYF